MSVVQFQKAGETPARRRVPRWFGPLVGAGILTLSFAGAWRFLGRDQSSVESLVQEVGERRLFEARLSGGFRYGPVVGSVRSTDVQAGELWSLMARAGEIRELADSNPTKENLRALAVARLLLGEVDASVRLLQDLVDEEPRDASLRSDLAAAYLTRAEREDRAEDWSLALDAAKAALDLEPNLREALFNKALALESLPTPEEAIEAWESYEAAFPADEWLPAVRERLEQLGPQSSVRDVDEASSLSGPSRNVGGVFALHRGVPENETPSIRITWADPGSVVRDPARVAEEVGRILGAIGVGVHWRAMGDTPPDLSMLGVIVVLRGDEPGSMGLAGNVMGASPRGAPRKGVYVFPAVARSVGLRPASLMVVSPRLPRALARVVAHEVIHALAPSIPHADSGLLRGHLVSAALDKTELILDPDSAHTFRRLLADDAHPAESSPAEARQAVLSKPKDFE